MLYILQEPDQPSILDFFSSQSCQQKRANKDRSVNDSTVDDTDILDMTNTERTELSALESEMCSPVRKRKRFSDSFTSMMSATRKTETAYSEPRRKISSCNENSKEPFIVIDSDEDDFATSSKKPFASSERKRKKVQRAKTPAKNNIKALFKKAASQMLTEDEPIARDGQSQSKGQDSESPTSGVKNQAVSDVLHFKKCIEDSAVVEGKIKAKTHAESQWSCDMCTFLNHKALNYCEICESPKGKTKQHGNKSLTVRVENSGKCEKHNVLKKENKTGYLETCETSCKSNSEGCERMNMEADISEGTSDCGAGNALETSQSEHMQVDLSMVSPIQSKYFGNPKKMNIESPVHRRKEVVIENTFKQKPSKTLHKTENAADQNQAVASSEEPSLCKLKPEKCSKTVSPSSSVKKYKFRSVQQPKPTNSKSNLDLSSPPTRPALDLLPDFSLVDDLLPEEESDFSEGSRNSNAEETPSKLGTAVNYSFSSPELDIVAAAQDIEDSGVFVEHMFYKFRLRSLSDW